MKKYRLILCGAVLCLLCCSCQTEQGGSDMKPESTTISATFVNDVEETDVWILPQTEENLKTSLWGTPTFSKTKAGEKRTGSVPAGETYILRMIDSAHAYYAANDLVLEDGCTVHFRTDGTNYDAQIDVTDKNGNTLTAGRSVFEGVFGAE